MPFYVVLGYFIFLLMVCFVFLGANGHFYVQNGF